MYNKRKMKGIVRLVLLVAVFFALTCCKGISITKTVWVSAAPAELDSVKGLIFTSLRFMNDKDVDVYQSVLVDTVFVVEPYMFAQGTYRSSGKTLKGTEITITARTLENDTLKYVGAFNKKKEMIISSNDSIIGIYTVVPNVVIK